MTILHTHTHTHTHSHIYICIYIYIQYNLMETQTRFSRHNKFISVENITAILSVSSDDSLHLAHIYCNLKIYFFLECNAKYFNISDRNLSMDYIYSLYTYQTLRRSATPRDKLNWNEWTVVFECACRQTNEFLCLRECVEFLFMIYMFVCFVCAHAFTSVYAIMFVPIFLGQYISGYVWVYVC